MNQYEEFKNRYQKEINALPLHFAFSDKQFKDQMNKMGLDPDKKEDMEKLVGIPAGGFMLKDDYPKFEDWSKRQSEEYTEKSKDMSFMYDAFIYEMRNHEYGYTYDDTDFLQALDISQKDLALNKELKETLDRAKRDYLAKCA